MPKHYKNSENIIIINFNVTKIMTIFVVINLIVKIFIALRPLEFIDGLLIPDDAYLSLTIARNIAHGLGPLYGTDFTNGFQPLYVFLAAPVFIVIPNDLNAQIHIVLLILALFDTLSLFFLYKFINLYTVNFWSFIFLGISWIFNPYILNNSINGLETSISMFFIIITLFYYFKYEIDKIENLKNGLIIGILCGLAIFSRIDNIFLLLSLVIIIIFEKKSFINKIKQIIRIITGAFITYLPWLIYSYTYTNDFFPISGKAIRMISLSQVNQNPTWENWYSKIIAISIKILYENNLGLLFVSIITITVIVMAFKKGYIKIKINIPVFLLLLFSIFLICSYDLYFFAFWFFERYFYPTVLVLIILNTILITQINISSINAKFKLIINILIITVFLAINLSQNKFTNVFLSKDNKNLGYMNIGLWCSKNFKNGMVIGSSQTGAMGFFAPNLKVVNLDGVVSKTCYESIVSKTNIEYIKEKKIEAIIGWQQNLSFIKNESINFKDSDLTVLGSVPGIKSRNYEWYICKVNY